MNSEKASKKLVQSLTDLVNMAKWLMDENEQPSVTHELERLFPSIRGRGKRGESSEIFRDGTGESSASATDTKNTSFATRSIIKQTIEKILESKATSKKPLKSISYNTTSGKTPSNFAILSRVKRSDFRVATCSCYFSSLIFQICSLKFSKQKVSYFEPFQSCPKGI